MNTEEIAALAATGESETVEFKRQREPAVKPRQPSAPCSINAEVTSFLESHRKVE